MRERHGVVTRAELRGLGLSDSQISRQLLAGEWRRAGNRILVHSSAPDGLRTESLVASARLPSAILTGPSAAVLRPHPAWANLHFRGQPPMLVARRHDRGPFRSVRHPGAVADPHPLGIQVADLHTTLVDLIRFLPWLDAAAVAARAIGLRATSVAALESSAVALSSLEGCRQLRRITEALQRGAESGPEIDLQFALWRARIRGWVANPTLWIRGRVFRPDIYFSGCRLALEYDGFSEHSGERRFHSDRVRGNTFAFDRYRCLHVTKRILYDPPEWATFVSDLRDLLRQ